MELWLPYFVAVAAANLVWQRKSAKWPEILQRASIVALVSSILWIIVVELATGEHEEMAGLALVLLFFPGFGLGAALGASKVSTSGRKLKWH